MFAIYAKTPRTITAGGALNTCTMTENDERKNYDTLYLYAKRRFE